MYLLYYILAKKTNPLKRDWFDCFILAFVYNIYGVGKICISEKI